MQRITDVDDIEVGDIVILRDNHNPEIALTTLLIKVEDGYLTVGGSGGNTVGVIYWGSNQVKESVEEGDWRIDLLAKRGTLDKAAKEILGDEYNE